MIEPLIIGFFLFGGGLTGGPFGGVEKAVCVALFVRVLVVS
jgi:hypothetical protein